MAAFSDFQISARQPWRLALRCWAIAVVCCLAGPAIAQSGAARQCGTPVPTLTEMQALQQYGQNLAAARPAAGPQTYVPLRIHIVRRSDGTGGANENSLYQGVAQANVRYANAGMQFYICGPLHYIDNTAWYDFASSSESALTAAPNYDANQINLYLTHSVSYNQSSVDGYAYTNPSSTRRRVFLTSLYADTYSHELGHIFGLLHPFENNNSPVVAQRELVARTNCTTAGDLLCDTPADPFGLAGVAYNPTTCTYASTSTATDAQGQPFAPDLSNVMGYWGCSPAAGFTASQYAAMRANRQASQANLTCTTAAPAAPTALALSANGCVGPVRLRWQNAAGTPAVAAYLVERADGSGSFAAVGYASAGAGSSTFQDNSAPSNTAVRYRVKPINAEAAFSNEAGMTTRLQYCAAGHTSATTCYAPGAIALGTIAIRQGAATTPLYTATVCGPSYSVFPSQYVRLLPGTSYTLTVNLFTYNGGTSSFMQYLGVWLDLNQNGSLADAGEQLFRSTTTGPGFTFSFTVPTAVANGCGALRFRTQNSSNGPVTDPCATLGLGETQDYPVLFGTAMPAATHPAAALGFSCAPNPATGTVQLHWEAGPRPTAPLLLLDLLGREARRYPSPTNAETVLDLHGLPAGVYVLRAGAGTGQKLVIN